MQIVLVHEVLRKEQYEESVRKLTGKSRMESPANGRLRVCSLKSQGRGEGISRRRRLGIAGAVDASAKHLRPMLDELGGQGRPEVYPAHTYVSA